MTPLSPPPPQPSTRLDSVLPIVALICAVVGLCAFPLLFVGLGLGVLALVQKKGSEGMALTAVLLPVCAIPVIAILAAIAIPNYLKFNTRSKQSECKTMLRQAYTAEKSYYAEMDVYDVHPRVVGFQPGGRTRYLYRFDSQGALAPTFGPIGAEYVGVAATLGTNPPPDNAALEAAIPAGVREKLGVHGKCPDCSVTIACAGNIDSDRTVDVWTISTAGADPGMPQHEVDDTRD